MSLQETVAAAFHEAYERLAPDYNYKTRDASAVPWADVPEDNKQLMTAVVADLEANGIINIAVSDGLAEVEPEDPPSFSRQNMQGPMDAALDQMDEQRAQRTGTDQENN